MNEPPFLVIRGCTKRFGKVTALRDLDLEVRGNELLVVLGPTGAGKTTLLRTIAGLEFPEEGTLLMNGEEITTLAPAERDVALVFQNFSLYPDWTVRANMEFPLKAPGRNLSTEEIEKQVEWAASILKIEPLLDRKATRLSGGEMQRVAIGRAIVRQPKLFLLDEPLTNLDAKLREALRVELVCLRRELGIPMIYVTHDQDEALSMGDRLVVLSAGRILQSGSPEEVYLHPTNPEVARQLGQPSINLIRVKREGDRWRSAGGLSFSGVRKVDGEEALLGIRPENISIRGGPHPARVEIVEDLGASRILLVDWAGEKIHILEPKSDPIRPGEEIHPRVEPDDILSWPSPVRTARSRD